MGLWLIELKLPGPMQYSNPLGPGSFQGKSLSISTVSEYVMELPPALDKLSKLKFGMPIAVLLVIVIDIALMSTIFFTDLSNSSFGPFFMLIAIVAITFTIFYVFGIRDMKYLMVFGIAVFLVVGSVVYILVLHESFGMPEPEPGNSEFYRDWKLASIFDLEDGTYFSDTSLHWYRLEGGDVTPYKDQMGTYRFNVTLYSNDPFIIEPDIRIAYARELWWDAQEVDMVAVNASDTDYTDGKDYEANVQIDTNAVYHHWYALVFDGGANPGSMNTTMIMGPLVGDESSLYGTYAGVGAINTFCNTAMLFFIVVLLYWWILKAKEQRKQWGVPSDDDSGDQPVSKDARFSCTKCGADVTDDDDKCPKCDESFDDDEKDDATSDDNSQEIVIVDSIADDEEEDEGGEEDEVKAEFTCTSCGADVFDSDEKCRLCGEGIEGEEESDFTCTSCGADAYDSDEKCGKCGEPFEGVADDDNPALHNCPHCNKEISEKLNFCPHCGKTMSGE